MRLDIRVYVVEKDLASGNEIRNKRVLHLD
jgi:hypothetical protein